MKIFLKMELYIVKNTIALNYHLYHTEKNSLRNFTKL